MQTNRRFWAVLIASIAILLVACGSGPMRLEVGDEIVIPAGYTLVAESEYGKYVGNVTFYCQNDRTGRVYTCNNGAIGSEVLVPEGYSLVGASAHGQYAPSITFYCRRNGTNRVFVCRE